MKFEYECIDSLPPLAWLAAVNFERGDVHACGGRSVSFADNWIFEGAWAGQYERGEFRTAETSFGSGLFVDKDCVVLSPPTSTLECVYYYVADKSTILMSNTLVGLTSTAGDRPRIDQTNYLRLFESARFGLDHYKAEIPMVHGTVRRVFYHSLVFQKRRSPSRWPRPAAFACDDFSAYRWYIKRQLALLAANAQAVQRTVKYPLLSTISSGYDSPTIAVLASELGCTEAVSLGKARAQFGHADDSGAEIAQHLGMAVSLYDRLAYLGHAKRYEAQFLSTGVGGEDIVFASFGSKLAGRCVLTGFLGDKVWGLDDPNLGLSLARADNGGGSLGEYRLDTDFIHVPCPYIGVLAQPSIQKISRSDEMQRWRIGGDYDRPIARRIIETAGIDRTAFGRDKKAVTQAIGLPHTFSFDQFPEDVADAYRSFQREQKFDPNALSRDPSFRRYSAEYVVTRFIWRKRSLPLWAKRMTTSAECALSLTEPVHGDYALLWQWSVSVRRSAYAAVERGSRRWSGDLAPR